jgi:hypothetical protein
MLTGAIDIYDGEGEVIGSPGEGGGDREVINGVLNEPKVLVIPGGKDASRSSGRGFEDKGSQGRWEEGGSEEGGDISEFGFLQKQDGGGGKLDCRPNVISLLPHPKAADIPAINRNFT